MTTMMTQNHMIISITEPILYCKYNTGDQLWYYINGDNQMISVKIITHDNIYWELGMPTIQLPKWWEKFGWFSRMLWVIFRKHP